MVGIQARRYLCVVCAAVLLVVPREMLARRRYSASAIGFALALWGLVLATAAEVRCRVSPQTILGFAGIGSWVTLRRWARAVREGSLFPGAPRPGGSSATLRQVAASVASALAASADPTTRHLPIEQRAFFGAAHAA